MSGHLYVISPFDALDKNKGSVNTKDCKDCLMDEEILQKVQSILAMRELRGSDPSIASSHPNLSVIIRRRVDSEAIQLYQKLREQYSGVILNIRSLVSYSELSSLKQILTEDKFNLLGEPRSLSLPAYITEAILKSKDLQDWINAQQWFSNIATVATHDFESCMQAMGFFPPTSRVILSPIYPAISCDHLPRYSIQEINNFIESLDDVSRLILLGGINRDRIMEWSSKYHLNFAVIGAVFKFNDTNWDTAESAVERVRGLLQGLKA